MQIQKMTSKKLEIEDKEYFSTRSVYEGGISEQELKKMLGMNGQVRLIPLIHRFWYIYWINSMIFDNFAKILSKQTDVKHQHIFSNLHILINPKYK